MEVIIRGVQLIWSDVWSNMPSFGKTNPLKKEHFDDLIKEVVRELKKTEK